MSIFNRVVFLSLVELSPYTPSVKDASLYDNMALSSLSGMPALTLTREGRMQPERPQILWKRGSMNTEKILTQQKEKK